MKFAVAFAAIMWSFVALKAIDEKTASADVAQNAVLVQVDEQNQISAQKQTTATSFAFDTTHGYRREWFPR